MCAASQQTGPGGTLSVSTVNTGKPPPGVPLQQQQRQANDVVVLEDDVRQQSVSNVVTVLVSSVASGPRVAGVPITVSAAMTTQHLKRSTPGEHRPPAPGPGCDRLLRAKHLLERQSTVNVLGSIIRCRASTVAAP